MPDMPAYERDPRLTRLETEVVSIGEDGGLPFVVLADTVLFPEGGGQPADRGRVGAVEVVDVQKAKGVIRHYTAGPPPTGAVTVELDWPRRLDHMQQHTGQHLLTAVTDRRYGWHTTSFHLGDRTCDIELDTPAVSDAQLTELEEMVATEIRAARPVTAQRVSPEAYADMRVRSRGLPGGHTGNVRLVEIEGIDVNTCGGTHLASTAEIEALKLLGTESVRGGTRLFWVAGRRLRRLHEAHHKRNAQLRELFATSDDDLVVRAAARLEQLKEAERAIRKLEEELAAAAAAALAAGPGPVLTAHWPDRDLPFLQKVGREAARLAPDRVVFLTSGEGDAGAFLLQAGDSSTLDVASAGPKVADTLKGRGGGSGKIFQGKAREIAGRDEAVKSLEGMA